MKLTKKAVLVCLILLMLSFVSASAFSEEDEFLVGLAMMATIGNRMDGVLSIGDYEAISALAVDAVDRKIFDLKYGDSDQNNEWEISNMTSLRNSIRKAIQQKIDQKNKQDARDAINTILQIAATIEDENQAVKTIPQVISDGAEAVDPSKDDDSLLNDVYDFAQDLHFNSAIDQTDLGIDTFVASLSDSTADISPPEEGAAGQDGSSVNLGGVSSDPNQTGVITDNELDLRPVRFVNSGTEPATVMVSEYTPAQGVSASMSMASTVVFAGQSNPSAMLDLPLGTYVFCYEWELDEDIDGDDYIDYKHGYTAPFTLNNNHSDTPELAVQVGFSAPAANPSSGRCRGDNEEAGGGLTPEEQANQGTHSYFVVESDGNADVAELFSNVGFNFANNRANVTIEGETITFVKAGTNYYTYADAELEMSFTFTLDGFYYTYKAEWGYDGIDYVISNGTGTRQ